MLREFLIRTMFGQKFFKHRPSMTMSLQSMMMRNAFSSVVGFVGGALPSNEPPEAVGVEPPSIQPGAPDRMVTLLRACNFVLDPYGPGVKVMASPGSARQHAFWKSEAFPAGWFRIMPSNAHASVS
jgi:hypothetical protein